MALSYSSRRSSPKSPGTGQAFAKLLIAALLMLLNGWRLEATTSAWDSWLIAGLSALAVYLIHRRIQAGIWLAIGLGCGFFSLTVTMVPPAQIPLVEPYLLWAMGVVIAGSALLWTNREQTTTTTSRR